MTSSAVHSLTEQHPIADWTSHPAEILRQFAARATREAEAAGIPGPPDLFRSPDWCGAFLYRWRTESDPEDSDILIPDAANPDIVELRMEWRGR